ncbi:MAG TPA: serine/threonine-protein kinase [Nocardioidaceae bacterium]|nr:serine/threonine-protein kinase [Nocardioidaceae bacterium]
MTDRSASWELARGDEIAPGLTAMKPLGGGSAYEVYLAFDDRLYAPVVVKVVRPDQVDDDSTLRGLDRECDLLQRLNHPAIVRGFRASIDPPRPYVMLENLDGPRLSSLIRRHGPVPPQQLLPLGIELCSAVHYLGEMGVVHLDIKPSNIIMGAPARLIDLSVARPIDRAATLRAPIGTDAYMAPEQCIPARDRAPAPESDIWGIGATLFHAVAGYRPFEDGDDGASAPEERWPQLVDPPMLLPEWVPDALAKPILACLDADQTARPTPVELAETFEPLMAALPKPRLGGWKPSLH